MRRCKNFNIKSVNRKFMLGTCGRDSYSGFELVQDEDVEIFLRVDDGSV